MEFKAGYLLVIGVVFALTRVNLCVLGTYCTVPVFALLCIPPVFWAYVAIAGIFRRGDDDIHPVKAALVLATRFAVLLLKYFYALCATIAIVFYLLGPSYGGVHFMALAIVLMPMSLWLCHAAAKRLNRAYKAFNVRYTTLLLAGVLSLCFYFYTALNIALPACYSYLYPDKEECIIRSLSPLNYAPHRTNMWPLEKRIAGYNQE